MKLFSVGLQDNVVSSYDKTKTTIYGRVAQKLLDGKNVLGPPLTKFIDVFTDTGLAPGGPIYLSPNGRCFVITAVSAGLATVLCYSFNISTGATAYLGKVILTLPNLAATTHAIRGFKVLDTGTTDWKIFVQTTGSVLINGGLFMGHNVALADFTNAGTTLPMATATDQKAVYSLQNPALLGATNDQTAGIGIILPNASSDVSINTKIFGFNGLVASNWQAFVHDWSGTPQVAGTQTGATITVGTPGIVTTGAAHGFLALDPVTFTAGTLPTGLVLGNTYFVTAANLTATTFSVSLTSGGAAINTTVTPGSGVTVMRAFGTCTNLFTVKSPITTFGTGVAVANSFFFARPSHTINSGFDCAFFATASNLYVGKLTELLGGSTPWPSLAFSDILGAVSDITAPVAAFASYSNECDEAVYITNTSTFVTKKIVNGQLRNTFGGLSNAGLEGLNPLAVPVSLAAVGGLESRGGWLLISGTTVRQRGVIAFDYRSDASFDYSKILSPVIKAVPSSVLKLISTYERLFDLTDSLVFEFRSAPSEADALFNTDSSGWISVATAEDLSTAAALSGAFQFCLKFSVANNAENTPTQVEDLLYAIQFGFEMSDKWLFSGDNSTQNGESPAYSAFRMKDTYASGTVPKLGFFAYLDDGTLVASANTVDNPTSFDKSTDNGTAWGALGTIPNTAGTTEVRYKWAVPYAGRVNVAFREIP